MYAWAKLVLVTGNYTTETRTFESCTEGQRMSLKHEGQAGELAIHRSLWDTRIWMISITATLLEIQP